MLPSLLKLHADSIRANSSLVAVLATPMAYKNKLPMKEDRKGMIQDYLKISAFR